MQGTYKTARLVQPSNCPGLSSVILLFVTFLRWRERERQGRREGGGGERREEEGGGGGREERGGRRRREERGGGRGEGERGERRRVGERKGEGGERRRVGERKGEGGERRIKGEGKVKRKRIAWNNYVGLGHLTPLPHPPSHTHTHHRLQTYRFFNLKAFFGLLVKQLVFMVELIVRLTKSSVWKDEQPVAIL